MSFYNIRCKTQPETAAKNDLSSFQVKHIFWNTQPIAKFKSEQDKEITQGEIMKIDPPSIRTTPYSLPEEFEWSNLNPDDDIDINDIYELMKNHYFEDSHTPFRLQYTIPFIRWLMAVSSNSKYCIIGIRVKANKKLVGMISGIPSKASVGDSIIDLVIAGFLCVHLKLRHKRMTPVLIKELARRVSINKVYQAAFITNKYLPNPITSANYHYRCINYRRLVEVIFSYSIGGFLPCSN